jgi:hypothetical protein
LNRAQVPEDLAAEETLRWLHEYERENPGVGDGSDDDADAELASIWDEYTDDEGSFVE